MWSYKVLYVPFEDLFSAMKICFFLPLYLYILDHIFHIEYTRWYPRKIYHPGIICSQVYKDIQHLNLESTTIWETWKGRNSLNKKYNNLNFFGRYPNRLHFFKTYTLLKTKYFTFRRSNAFMFTSIVIAFFRFTEFA